MKRIVFLLVLVCLVGVCSDSYAKIHRNVDSFSENIGLSSYNELDSIDSLQFYKIIKKNSGKEYSLLLDSNTRAERQLYSKEDAQIKIGGNIYPLKVIRTEYKKFDYADDSAKVEVEIPQDIIEKLENTEKVSIRFFAEKGYDRTIDVPDSVLAEWKQVIATEK